MTRTLRSFVCGGLSGLALAGFIWAASFPSPHAAFDIASAGPPVTGERPPAYRPYFDALAPEAPPSFFE